MPLYMHDIGVVTRHRWVCERAVRVDCCHAAVVGKGNAFISLKPHPKTRRQMQPVGELPLMDNFHSDERQTAEITVNRCIIGRVIGKNGETIKALQIYTGALIQIDQSTEPTRVTVSGALQSLTLAINMISDISNGSFKGFALLRQMVQQPRPPIPTFSTFPHGTAQYRTQSRPMYAPGCMRQRSAWAAPHRSCSNQPFNTQPHGAQVFKMQMQARCSWVLRVGCCPSTASWLATTWTCNKVGMTAACATPKQVVLLHCCGSHRKICICPSAVDTHNVYLCQSIASLLCPAIFAVYNIAPAAGGSFAPQMAYGAPHDFTTGSTGLPNSSATTDTGMAGAASLMGMNLQNQPGGFCLPSQFQQATQSQPSSGMLSLLQDQQQRLSFALGNGPVTGLSMLNSAAMMARQPTASGMSLSRNMAAPTALAMAPGQVPNVAQFQLQQLQHNMQLPQPAINASLALAMQQPGPCSTPGATLTAQAQPKMASTMMDHGNL
ncbi:KH domain-containing protein, partial [Haematococcus lacustris]